MILLCIFKKNNCSYLVQTYCCGITDHEMKIKNCPQPAIQTRIDKDVL